MAMRIDRSRGWLYHVGMHRSIHHIPFCLLFALTSIGTNSLLAAEISKGASEDEVIKEMGMPTGKMKLAQKEVWNYERGTITFFRGKAIIIALVTTGGLARIKANIPHVDFRRAALDQARELTDKTEEAKGLKNAQLLLELMASSPERRFSAIWYANKNGTDDARVIRQLIDLFSDFTRLPASTNNIPFIGGAAIYAVTNLGTNSLPELHRGLRHKTAWNQMGAAAALGQIGDRSSIPYLRTATNKPYEGVFYVARESLRFIRGGKQELKAGPYSVFFESPCPFPTILTNLPPQQQTDENISRQELPPSSSK